VTIALLDDDDTYQQLKELEDEEGLTPEQEERFTRIIAG
jgi:hypothetical protein